MNLPYQPAVPPPARKHTRWLVVALIAALLVICVLAVLLVSDRGSQTVVGSTQPSAATTSPANTLLADVYVGTTTNATGGVTERLEIRFTSKNPAALKGDVLVGGPRLRGSGKFFAATLTDGSIHIPVKPTDGAQQYELVGSLNPDGSLSGSLVVPAAGLQPAQSGSWVLQPQG